ncbi:MAG TPA: hypothetical protein VGW37_11310 [Terriglobia bacterium]|nr:hypothetical protein [Terriglobia bacterium]
MSTGTRHPDFRQGDRSEYLAVYILSALGLVTQVPRQEDIGFDLVCNLSEKNQYADLLSFRYHYAVSVKSASKPRAVLAPPKSMESNKNYTGHFDWLFNLELPLMLAVVNKNKQTLSLYSTLPAWFLFYLNRPEIGIIELVPRMKTQGPNPGVDKPKPVGADGKAGGRIRFQVDLGFPIAVISVVDLHKPALLQEKKKVIQLAVELGAASARFAQTHTPYFWWIIKTQPAGGILDYGWFVQNAPVDQARLIQMMNGLAPGLMSAALLFKRANRPDLLNSLRDSMRLLPGGSVPPEVQKELPEIFNAPAAQ